MGSSSLDEAFAKVRRDNFLPADVKDQADRDAALPIGFGQTNSQPYTVRLMLTWLDVEKGMKVLDVGSGSGWTTALLAHLAGPKGIVYAVEKIPELKEFGESNVKRIGIKNARYFLAGQQYGIPEYAPYDRILVSASSGKLPKSLINQLKVGGKIVIPVHENILEIRKTADDKHEVISHAGFIFVPLV